MRKQRQSQQSQSSVSVDIHSQTAQKESSIITTEGCRSNSSTFGFLRALHGDVDQTSPSVSSPLSRAATWIGGFLAEGLNGLAGVSGYLGLSSSYGTKWGGGDEPLSGLPVTPGGSGAGGQEGSSERGPFSCRATSPESPPPAPLDVSDWQLSSSCGTCTPATRRR